MTVTPVSCSLFTEIRFSEIFRSIVRLSALSDIHVPSGRPHALLQKYTPHAWLQQSLWEFPGQHSPQIMIHRL